MDAVKTKEPSKHVRHVEVSNVVITHDASSSAKRSFLPHSTSQQQRTLAFLYLVINHKREPIGPRHAKRARTTWHVISSNLHLKSSAKNGGSNWVLIQGAIITVLIVISGLLSLPSCYLENEVGKKLKTQNRQNMSSGLFSHDVAQLIRCGIWMLHLARILSQNSAEDGGEKNGITR